MPTDTQNLKVRLDKYLWSIRIFKTRALATEACEKGKVKLQEDSVKPSRNVKKGDVYEVKTPARKWLIEVTQPLDHRVAYSEAILHYKDITPAEEIERMQFEASAFHTGKRLSKIGRPTKKNKRDLDEFLGGAL
jgi:ribosome-associated heat shock protein Hsp15